MAYDVLAVT